MAGGSYYLYKRFSKKKDSGSDQGASRPHRDWAPEIIKKVADKMDSVVDAEETVKGLPKRVNFRDIEIMKEEEQNVEYESLTRQYIKKQTPELRGRLQVAHQNLDRSSQVALYNILEKPLPPLEPLDDYLRPFFESPWKSLLEFENDKIPSKDVIRLIENFNETEARGLPFAPSLKPVIFNSEARKDYVKFFRKLNTYENNHTAVPFAQDFFPLLDLLPAEAIEKVNALLDVNWSKRAEIALRLYRQNMLESSIPFIKCEYQHLESFVWRRSSKPSTHITKEEFNEIFDAMKVFDEIYFVTPKRFDITSRESFVISLLEGLKEYVSIDFRNIWKIHKEDHLELLEKHNKHHQEL